MDRNECSDKNEAIRCLDHQNDQRCFEVSIQHIAVYNVVVIDIQDDLQWPNVRFRTWKVRNKSVWFGIKSQHWKNFGSIFI